MRTTPEGLTSWLLTSIVVIGCTDEDEAPTCEPELATFDPGTLWGPCMPGDDGDPLTSAEYVCSEGECFRSQAGDVGGGMCTLVGCTGHPHCLEAHVISQAMTTWPFGTWNPCVVLCKSDNDCVVGMRCDGTACFWPDECVPGMTGETCDDACGCAEGLTCDGTMTCSVEGGEGECDTYDPLLCMPPGMLLSTMDVAGNFCGCPCVLDEDCPMGPPGTLGQCALTLMGDVPEFCALACTPGGDDCPAPSTCNEVPSQPGVGLCTYPV